MAMDRIPTLSGAFDWRRDSIEWPVETDVGPGLSGVIAAETRVMWLDPSSGQLAYRGIPIEQLAAHATFEEVAHLLITGRNRDEDPDGLEAFTRQLRSSRGLPPDVTAQIRAMDPDTHPIRILRPGISTRGGRGSS